MRFIDNTLSFIGLKNPKTRVDDSFLKWRKDQSDEVSPWFIKKAELNLDNKKEGSYFTKSGKYHLKAIKKDGKIEYFSRLRRSYARKWKGIGLDGAKEIVYTPKEYGSPFSS